MKRKFAILLSAMLLTQAFCGCGGAASHHSSRPTQKGSPPSQPDGQHREQIERKSGDRDG